MMGAVARWIACEIWTRKRKRLQPPSGRREKEGRGASKRRRRRRLQWRQQLCRGRRLVWERARRGRVEYRSRRSVLSFGGRRCRRRCVGQDFSRRRPRARKRSAESEARESWRRPEGESLRGEMHGVEVEVPCPHFFSVAWCLVRVSPYVPSLPQTRFCGLVPFFCDPQRCLLCVFKLIFHRCLTATLWARFCLL